MAKTIDDSPAPVVAEVRRAPIDLEVIQRRADAYLGQANVLEPYVGLMIRQMADADIPVLLAEVGKLQSELASLRTRLRGLEQQWRKSTTYIPGTSERRAWENACKTCADELARLLTTPEEPGT